MGADLLVQSVVFGYKDIAKIPYTEIENELLRRAKNMRLSKEKLEDVYGAFGDAPPETTQDARDDLQVVIQQFFECLDWRDVTWIRVTDKIVFITGGMSWGDTPTDSYDRFWKFMEWVYAFPSLRKGLKIG